MLQVTSFPGHGYEAALQVDAFKIGHFTVVCSVTWPLNGSEAGGDLVLIKDLSPFVV